MTKQLWTKEEEDRLIMMAAQGKTNRQIADALRRTECAVAHKYAKLGIKKREPEELKAEEPEDDTGDGSTELEREIRFQASVIDALSNDLKAYREQVEDNLATVMERANELSKDATQMRDAAHGLTKEVSAFADRLYIVELWLSQSRFYRLTHSFRKFAEAHRED